MRCQTRAAFLCKLLTLSLTLSMNSGIALAHQTDFTGATQAGSNGLVTLGLLGRWGFEESTPWYVSGAFDRTTVGMTTPTIEAYHAGAEVGREDRRFSYAARYNYTTTSTYGLQSSGPGLSLRVRFIPWEKLSTRERNDGREEDKRVVKQEKERQAQEAVPGAPVLLLDVDSLYFDSKSAIGGGLTGQQASAFFMYRLKPWITLVPGIFAYAYSGGAGAGPNSPGNRAIFSMPSVRMLTIGPQGAYSGIYGAISGAQQLLTHFNFSPHFAGQFAITRVQVAAPESTQYSYWMGFERRIGMAHNWAVQMAYEFVNGPPATSGYFTFRFRKELTAAFVPGR